MAGKHRVHPACDHTHGACNRRDHLVDTAAVVVVVVLRTRASNTSSIGNRTTTTTTASGVHPHAFTHAIVIATATSGGRRVGLPPRRTCCLPTSSLALPAASSSQ